MQFVSLKQKIKIFFTDHFNLLFHSAAENHLRMQKQKDMKPEFSSGEHPETQNNPSRYPSLEKGRWSEGEKETEPPVEAKPPTPTPVTNLEFNSFTHLKRYQKRLRIATLSTSSTIIAIIAVAISLQFLGSHSRGATFGWVQTDWSGLSSNLASHLTDRTGWTSYSAKDDSIDTSNGELKLATVSGSVTETDDESGFADGSHDGTSSSGTGVAITSVGELPVTYPSSGIFTSQITDTGHKNASWGNLEWTTVQTVNTLIVFKARTSNNSDMSGAADFASCDPVVTVNSANSTSSAVMSGNNCVHAGDRYVQYQATLSTSNSLETPEVQDVEINYSFYSPSPLSNIAKTSDADFSTNTNSNVGISGSGNDALLALLKPSHAVCANDSDCGSGNCDTDFASATKYCHTTASSCADSSGEPWEQVDGYEKCSGNDYYKTCANSIWGEQQNNPNLTNSYCDAGGGEQSGYQSAATCTSGTDGGFDSPACNSCFPYIAETTSSCKTSCTGDSDCYGDYICSGDTCINPWLAGPCEGIQVYYVDAPTNKTWKTSTTACSTPQCSQDGGQYGDNLVADNSVDFSLYPARDFCKSLGGRMPNITEMRCIFTNAAQHYGGALGGMSGNAYWVGTEYSTSDAVYVSAVDSGALEHHMGKTSVLKTRCIRDHN
ncbi:MAG TPA: hypothetical protein PLF30_02845 [Candidatus Moranbacteria bacterium]|jgi:hypothetical protein|nr:hypothetical protein [Candidatus Moranbacteria bacterium]HQB59646.1 hypothetical protein [Candidatus Moranbacteria bacterium]